MKPEPSLLQSLARSKLLPRRASASAGFGERRSRSKGSGMEFIDHRAYQAGDDLRRIDPHLRGRLGENFVRQYQVQRQLPVTILIDRSTSMSANPHRERSALAIAALAGFVALAGGDLLRVGMCAGGTVCFSPRFEGLGRADQFFDWLDSFNEADGSFRDSLTAVPADPHWQGLTLLVSDFWDETESEISRLAAAGQELWCLHLETPEEVDPSLLGLGDIRMIDAETGEEIDLMLDRDALAQYQAERNAFRSRLQTGLLALGGAYIPVSTATPMADMVQWWRGLGLIS